MTELGAAIRRARRASDVSQVDLAQRLDVRQATVSDWEVGRATPSIDVFTQAWTLVLERLERTSAKDPERPPLMLLHDEGQNDLLRKMTRKARRHLMVGSHYSPQPMRLKAECFVDDPMPRNSKHSYFVQMADVVAYAAFRHVFPPTRSDPIVTGRTWLECGAALHLPVNSVRGSSHPAIVVRENR